MNRRTIFAVGLLALFLIFYYPALHWLGLDRYLGSRTPTRVAQVDSTARGMVPDSGEAPAFAPPLPAAGATATIGDRAGVPSLGITSPVARAGAIERSITLETPLYVATFNSRGARLVSVELKHYASAHGASASGERAPVTRRGKEVPPADRVVLAGGPSFGLDLGSGNALHSLENVVFAVQESLDASGVPTLISFTASDTSGWFVRQSYRVQPDDYALGYEVEMRGVPAHWRIADYSLIARSWPLFTESDILADVRTLKASSQVGSNLHHEGVGGLLKGPKQFDGNATWAAVHTRYFLGAVAVREGTSRGVVSGAALRDLTPDQQKLVGPNAKPTQELAINTLVMGIPAPGHPVDRYLLYVGPAEYFRVEGYKLQLHRALDLGFSWILPFSKALLWLLTWIYGLVKNYGVAIVLLATLVRVVLHPLNMTSMKSMRAMQKLQPEVQRIREKYKNDAQAMNAAIMALYKENKVNPAGGCLPMVMQMPLFFALYAVLFNAIELRQAPFIGWIHDLSAPDQLGMVMGFPIRLLPLLMAGSGLLQQWLTPTDPSQAPTMYIMNVVMVVFFYNLPSGLVLYWTVMNLLTALQQWMVLRQDGGSLTPEPVAVAAVPRAGKRRR